MIVMQIHISVEIDLLSVLLMDVLPKTTDTCALLREILKAGVKEFGELMVFGRKVSTEGRLKSNVWLKFPDR